MQDIKAFADRLDQIYADGQRFSSSRRRQFKAGLYACFPAGLTGQNSILKLGA